MAYGMQMTIHGKTFTVVKCLVGVSWMKPIEYLNQQENICDWMENRENHKSFPTRRFCHIRYQTPDFCWCFQVHDLALCTKCTAKTCHTNWHYTVIQTLAKKLRLQLFHWYSCFVWAVKQAWYVAIIIICQHLAYIISLL